MADGKHAFIRMRLSMHSPSRRDNALFEAGQGVERVSASLGFPVEKRCNFAGLMPFA